jgi:hypothetical protein
VSYGLQSHRYSAFCARRQVKTEDLITPGKKLLFSAPTLILDNGLDQAHHFGEPACMPSGFGTDRWLGAINGPVWNINATYYGHVDCLDAAFISMGKIMCPSNATTDKLLYHAELANATGTFLDALFEHRPDDFALLQDANRWGIATTVRWDLGGLTPDQVVPGCTRHNPL